MACSTRLSLPALCQGEIHAPSVLDQELLPYWRPTSCADLCHFDSKPRLLRVSSDSIFWTPCVCETNRRGSLDFGGTLRSSST